MSCATQKQQTTTKKNESETLFAVLLLQVLSTANELLVFLAAAGVSLRLHARMLSAVLRSPMRFFDTAPLGRVVARFAKDLDVVDNRLPQILADWIYCLFEVPRIALPSPFSFLDPSAVRSSRQAQIGRAS